MNFLLANVLSGLFSFGLVSSRLTPILTQDDLAMNRQKRQFEFDFQNQNFQNQRFPTVNNGLFGNSVFFDNENMFNDFVQPSRARTNQRQRQSTPRPSAGTTVAIPGMGTSPSPCETRCMTTPQYDPVCADNNVTYNNVARFNCALRCGKNIRIVAYRACPRV